MNLGLVSRWCSSFFEAQPKKTVVPKENALKPVRTAKPVLLVTLLELEDSVVSDVINRVQKKFSRRFTIIYVTSGDNFAPFLENKVPFEFLIGLDAVRMHREILDWSEYLPEKWELLLMKWKPQKVISFGLSLDRFFNQIGCN